MKIQHCIVLLLIIFVSGCNSSSCELYEIAGFNPVMYPINGSNIIQSMDDNCYYLQTQIKSCCNRSFYSIDPLVIHIDAKTNLMKQYSVDDTRADWMALDAIEEKITVSIYSKNNDLGINIEPFHKEMSFNLPDDKKITQEIFITYDSFVWIEKPKDGWKYGYFDIIYKYTPANLLDSKRPYAITQQLIRVNIRKKI